MALETYDDIIAAATDEDKKLQTSSLHDSKPESILIAAGPDKLDETTLIATKTFEAQLGFTFTERLWAPKAFLAATADKREKRGNCHFLPDMGEPDKTIYCYPTINGERAKEITGHLTGLPYDSYMLVNMGKLGYGLMTRTRITKSDMLFNYTGTFTSKSAQSDSKSVYMFSIQDSFFGLKEPIDFDPMNPPLYYNFSETGIIDADHYRNFSAFAQHAPHSYELTTDPSDCFSKYVVKCRDILKSVGTNSITSVSFQEAYIDGLTCLEFHANDDIPAYTMIFINYGNIYWITQKRQPELFTKQGACIDYSDYYPTNLYLENPTGNQNNTLVVNTAGVFLALLNGVDTEHLSADTLKILTLQHLGEARFKGHLTCFLSKNPNVVLDYRKDRFFSKNPGVQENSAQFKSRMKHFGFSFFNLNCSNNEGESVNLMCSDPKLPKSLINSICESPASNIKTNI